MSAKDEARTVALELARAATKLQVAVVGQTNLAVTDRPLDVTALCEAITEKAATVRSLVGRKKR